MLAGFYISKQNIPKQMAFYDDMELSQSVCLRFI